MKPTLVLLLSLFCLSGFSQDLIITKTGEQIKCHILQVDTLKIIYRLINESPRHEIKRDQVENYYLSKTTASELEYLNRPLKEFFSIGFFGGLANPIGDFASMDAESELSGLAFRGYSFNGELIFKLSTNIGLKLSYLSQKHDLNYQVISNYYNNYFVTNNFTAGGGAWQINGLLFGLNVDLPFKETEGLSFAGSVDLGALNFTYPEQFIMGSPNPQVFSTTKVTITESSTNSGALKIGLGLRYKLSKYIAAHLTGSYFAAHPAFFEIEVSSSNGFSEIITYEQQIRTVNLQAGLSFLFYKK